MAAPYRKTARVASIGLIAAATASFATSPALAAPTITADFTAGFSAADEAVVESALNFYDTNMTSTFAITVDLGTQAPGTGASSEKDVYSALDYSSYYSALAANAASTGNAVQQSAVASLDGPNGGNNPVTGSSSISMASTLAGVLGLAPQLSETWSDCGNLVGTACITIGTDYLSSGNGGSPTAGLLSALEHEFDEVLGTSSNLPNGPTTTITGAPSAADLFRYSVPGVRSYATNASKAVPCNAGTPNAYFSVDGGTTNLNNYNNCANGGDYGDWAYDTSIPPQVQDAFGDTTGAPFLTLASPEVALLEAVGYDFNSPVIVTAAPEPASIGIMAVGLAALHRIRRKRAA